MALHMQLMVNDGQIGYLYARRLSPDRPRGNDICRYEWRININGRTNSNLEDEPLAHRFSDGAWALVARIVEAAGYMPTPADGQDGDGPRRSTRAVTRGSLEPTGPGPGFEEDPNAGLRRAR